MLGTVFGAVCGTVFGSVFGAVFGTVFGSVFGLRLVLCLVVCLVLCLLYLVLCSGLGLVPWFVLPLVLWLVLGSVSPIHWSTPQFKHQKPALACPKA